ncbi:hypothetical protein [Sphingopyxis sp.]|uniref:hypothetical protein n=1 Tax=Sphingopyxis sp. TaxID=1908224 RepID=UPI003D6D6392
MAAWTIGIAERQSSSVETARATSLGQIDASGDRSASMAKIASRAEAPIIFAVCFDRLSWDRV